MNAAGKGIEIYKVHSCGTIHISTAKQKGEQWLKTGILKGGCQFNNDMSRKCSERDSINIESKESDYISTILDKIFGTK